jgi:hypothetical protein
MAKQAALIPKGVLACLCCDAFKPNQGNLGMLPDPTELAMTEGIGSGESGNEGRPLMHDIQRVK